MTNHRMSTPLCQCRASMHAALGDSIAAMVRIPSSTAAATDATPAEAMLTPSSSVDVRGGGASPSSGVSAPEAARSPLSSCSIVPRSGSSIVQYSAANGMSFAKDAPVPA